MYVCIYAYTNAMYVYIYIYIYIYTHGFVEIVRGPLRRGPLNKTTSHHSIVADRAMICMSTPNLPTNIVDLRGFDSSIILILKGGIPRPIGISSLTQAMLVGTMLVGGLDVHERHC